MLLHTTITRKWPSFCWTKERLRTLQRRYQETLTNHSFSTSTHKSHPKATTHTQMMKKHGCKPNGCTHAHTKPAPPHILDHFRHFTSSPPTVTTEDGKLMHILLLWKRKFLKTYVLGCCSWSNKFIYILDGTFSWNFYF